MNRFIIGVLVVLVIIAGVGFYLGWFRIAWENGSDSIVISLTVDKTKFRSDEGKVEQKAKDLEQKVKDKVGHGNDQDKE
jgi:hypothetical protein